jgi:hypothetical protein
VFSAVADNNNKFNIDISYGSRDVICTSSMFN